MQYIHYPGDPLSRKPLLRFRPVLWLYRRWLALMDWLNYDAKDVPRNPLNPPWGGVG